MNIEEKVTKTAEIIREEIVKVLHNFQDGHHIQKK